MLSSSRKCFTPFFLALFIPSQFTPFRRSLFSIGTCTLRTSITPYSPSDVLRLMESPGVPTLLHPLLGGGGGSQGARHSHQQHHPHSSAFPGHHHGPGTFSFRPRRGTLDLRILNRLDVDRIAACVDIDALQRHVENLAFACLTEEDLAAHSDQAVIKGFRLAQLTIEYLLNVQDCLAYQLDRMAAQHVHVGKKVEKLKLRLRQACLATTAAAAAAVAAPTAVKMPFSPSRKHASNHHDRRHHHRRHHHNHAAAPSLPPSLPAEADHSFVPTPTVLRLYVTFANGSCVVATAPSNLLLHELKAQVLPDMPAIATSTENRRRRRRKEEKVRRLSERDFRLVYRGLRLSDDKSLRELEVPDNASLFCLIVGDEGPREEEEDKEEEEEEEARKAATVEAEKVRLLTQNDAQQSRLRREQAEAMAIIQERLAQFETHVLGFLEQQQQRQEQHQQQQQRNPAPSPSPPPPPSLTNHCISSFPQPQKVAEDSLSIDERVRLLLAQMERRIRRKVKRLSITSTDMTHVRKLKGLLSSEIGRLGVTGLSLPHQQQQHHYHQQQRHQHQQQQVVSVADKKAGGKKEEKNLEARLAHLHARRSCLSDNVKSVLDKIQGVAQMSLTQVPRPFALQTMTTCTAAAAVPPCPSVFEQESSKSSPPPFPPPLPPPHHSLSLLAPVKPPKRRTFGMADMVAVSKAVQDGKEKDNEEEDEEEDEEDDEEDDDDDDNDEGEDADDDYERQQEQQQEQRQEQQEGVGLSDPGKHHRRLLSARACLSKHDGGEEDRHHELSFAHFTHDDQASLPPVATTLSSSSRSSRSFSSSSPSSVVSSISDEIVNGVTSMHGESNRAAQRENDHSQEEDEDEEEIMTIPEEIEEEKG